MEEEAQLGLVVVEDVEFEGRHAADGNQGASIKVDFVTFTIHVDDIGAGEKVNGNIPQHGSLPVVAPSSEKAVEEVEGEKLTYCRRSPWSASLRKPE